MTTTLKLNERTLKAIDRSKARFFLIKPDGVIWYRGPGWAFNVEANALKYAAHMEGVVVYDKETKAYLASQPAPAPAAVTSSDAPVIEPRTQTRLAEAEAMLADAGTVEATGSARQTIRWDNFRWIFAETMAHIPHEYVRRSPEIEADYVELWETIGRDGVLEKFGKAKYRYWYPGDGYKYWRMTNDIRQSIIINRAKVMVDQPAPDVRLLDSMIEVLANGKARHERRPRLKKDGKPGALSAKAEAQKRAGLKVTDKPKKPKIDRGVVAKAK